MSDILVFTGSFNPELAENIVRHLSLPLGKATLQKLKNGETYVELEQTVRCKDVYIVQSGCGEVNDAILELLIFISACKSNCADRVTAVLPNFPYSKHDRRIVARSPISAKLVANMITVAGADRVISMDLHSSQVQGFFDVAFDHLYAEPAIRLWITTNVPDWRQSIIISPDAGGTKRVCNLAESLEIDFGMVDKTARSDTPRIVGNVKGKTCIILDDLIDTGATLVYAAEKLMDAGAKRVMAIATHGIFSESSLIDLDQSPVDEIVVTNTIPQDEHMKICKKLKCFDVSNIFAEAIRRTHNGESISYLFSHVPVY